MPVVVQGVAGQIVWKTEEVSRALGRGRDRTSVWADCLSIALVNNMPDLALQDTELQFLEILNAASGTRPVLVKLFSLPQIVRTGRARDRLNAIYFGVEDLWNSRFHAMIVTGTEPHHDDLREEPYWRTLADILRWAEENTFSAVLSCLAAHAGVLYSDGIIRSPLADKQFGVFEFQATGAHALLEGTETSLAVPHSRWNEVRAEALSDCGYQILTQSAEAGVDLFVKRKKNSLLIHFQGHPEYDKLTLFKEYRRDIRRFLKNEREVYPRLPHGYFDAATNRAMGEFRSRAVANRSEDLLAEFPQRLATTNLKNTWRFGATCIYRQWVEYIESRKAGAPAVSAQSSVPRPRPEATALAFNTETI